MFKHSVTGPDKKDSGQAGMTASRNIAPLSVIHASEAHRESFFGMLIATRN